MLPAPRSLQPREQPGVVAHPVDQLPHALPHADRRLPAEQPLRLADVADEHGLVAGPPVAPLQRYLDSQLGLEIGEQLAQRHRVARARRRC